MDPLSAFSLATGIVTFVDFGSKLLSLYLQIRESNDGRPAVVSALETELQELSGNARHAREKVASLQARYPRQSEALARLDAECVQVERELRSLAGGLTIKPGRDSQGLRGRGAQALVAFRGMLKQGSIEGLQSRLRSIREQTMMGVMMCILDDVAEGGEKLNGVGRGIGEVLNMLRPMKTAIDNLQPEFQSISRNKPLATTAERNRMAGGLWTSIAAVNQADLGPSPERTEVSPGNDRKIRGRVLESLEFEDMMARQSQIHDPFPETFQWLLCDDGPDDGLDGSEPSGSARQPTKFKEWLASQANDTPYWVTGKPASGKSTLMKFICTNSEVRTHLRAWSEASGLGLITCNVYFWNPGSSGQKNQAGLLRTILHQLLRQRPDLCPAVASRRQVYFQLAGAEAPNPPDWTLEELRDSIARFVSAVEGTECLAIFIDGLDEYEGNLEELVSFVKKLHQSHNVKLCVSSRPWNVFKDEFRTYPSLKMELFTKPDIERYVRTRISTSPAFQELRALEAASVANLETQIIEKADGVFLWVVLVVEKIIATARENNDLREIWAVFDDLPPGLEELYSSMRRRLDPAQRERASVMYQLLFRWSEVMSARISAGNFWMAIGCQNPIELQHCPTGEEMIGILPALERRLVGATGGMVQLVHSDHIGSGPLSFLSMNQRKKSVDFFHRTVFDWLRSIESSVVSDGPAGYDPSLVLTSVTVSQLNQPRKSDYDTPDIGDPFMLGQSCNNAPDSRAKLLKILDQLRVKRFDQDQGTWFLQLGEDRILFSYPDLAVRSFLAARFLCPQYLQARLESKPHATLGIELPKRLHMVPRRLWDRGYKDLISRVLTDVLEIEETDTVQHLNLRLKTFEVLLQAQFMPRRVVAGAFKTWAGSGRNPTVYWQALHAGLEGGRFSELTSLPRDEVIDESRDLTMEDVVWKRPPVARQIKILGPSRRALES